MWLGWAVTDVTESCDLRWSHMCAIFLMGEVTGGMDFPFTSKHQGTSVTMTEKILRGYGTLCLIVKTITAMSGRTASSPCLLAFRI